jgi:hypothetical protein
MRFASMPVRTPGGKEAATWTRNGKAELVVWRKDPGGDWTEIGTTRYPTNTGLRHCAPFVTGSAVTDDADAVFIVHDCFAGDGSVNGAAISDGPAGWGVLEQPSAHRMMSAGAAGKNEGPASAIHWDIEFDKGGLATSDNAGNFGNAGANAFPRIEIWRWHHGGFTAVDDSRFRARPAVRPDLRTGTFVGRGCPANGTYAASFSGHPVSRRYEPPNAPMRIKIWALQTGRPSTAPICTEFVSPLIPISVHVGYTTTSLTRLNYRRSTNRRWITGPAWLLIQGVGGFGVPAPIFYRHTLDNPWFIPTSVKDNLLLSRLGSPPATGTVTFTSGQLTSLAAS